MMISKIASCYSKKGFYSEKKSRMPYSCCVPACRGNYDDEDKVSIFTFPKDEDLKNKWLRAIPRSNFSVTKNSRVCEKHFKDGDVLYKTTFVIESTGEVLTASLKRPKLKENAIPSIFPGCPAYLSNPSTSRESPQEKRLRMEQAQIEQSVKESIKASMEYATKTQFETFEELQNCVKNHEISSHWTVLIKSDHLLFMDISVNANVPSLKYAVSINKALNINVSFKGHEILHYNGCKLPFSVNNINQILEVLQYFENTDNNVNIFYDNLNIVESILKNSIEDAFPFLDCCFDGHAFRPLIQTVIKSSVNCLLNNYCKVKNDHVKSKKVANISVETKDINKRKLETFSNSNGNFKESEPGIVPPKSVKKQKVLKKQ